MWKPTKKTLTNSSPGFRHRQRREQSPRFPLPCEDSTGAFRPKLLLQLRTSRVTPSQSGATGLSVQPLVNWLMPTIAIGLPLVTLALACLMVSRVRYSHVFNQVFRGHRSRGQLLTVIFTLALVFIVREMAVPVILLYFTFSAPIKSVFGFKTQPLMTAHDVDSHAA